jgi:hypothetical protein
VLSNAAVLWVIVAVALVVALLAWRQARATAKRLEQLSQMYWELKYQHGELRALVQRLSSGEPPPSSPAASNAGAEPRSQVIPLSSLKR